MCWNNVKRKIHNQTRPKNEKVGVNLYCSHALSDRQLCSIRVLLFAGEIYDQVNNSTHASFDTFRAYNYCFAWNICRFWSLIRFRNSINWLVRAVNLDINPLNLLIFSCIFGYLRSGRLDSTSLLIQAFAV